MGLTSPHEATAASRRGYILLNSLLTGRHVSHNVAINLANLLHASVTRLALPSRRMQSARSGYVPRQGQNVKAD